MPLLRPRAPTGLSDDCPLAAPIRDYVHNLVVGHPGITSGPSAYRHGFGHSLLLIEILGSAASRRRRPRRLAGIERWLERYLRTNRAPRTPGPPADAARESLASLANLVSLDGVEQQLLQLLLAVGQSGALEQLFESFGLVSLPAAARLVATAADLPLERVLSALQATSRLISSGLVHVERGRGTFPEKLVAKEGLPATEGSPSGTTPRTRLPRSRLGRAAPGGDPAARAPGAPRRPGGRIV